jgi:peptide/nickel transport system permease protein
MRLSIFVVRRLLSMVVMLLSISLVTFALSHIVPGDPARLIAGMNASNEQVAKIRVRLGLDHPLPEQYFTYLTGLLHGDLGDSVLNGRPVLENLARFFPATVELALAAFLIAAFIGVPLGVISAVKRNSPIDQIIRVTSLVGVALPSFWIGIILILVFFFYLGWLPQGRQTDTRLILEYPVSAVTNFLLIDTLLAHNWIVFVDALKHLILPAVTLALGPLARFARFTRTVMLETLDEEFIRVARAKGVREWSVIWRHALRNALIPVTTLMGLAVGYMLGGSVLVETVFSWPGIGQYAYDSIVNLDYPAILGTTLLATIVFLFSNFVVDILYVALDPLFEYA